MATKSHSSYRGWEVRNQKCEQWDGRTSWYICVSRWGEGGVVCSLGEAHQSQQWGPQRVVYMKWRIPVQPVTPPSGFELWVVWVHPNSYFEFENIFSRWIISLHIAASKWEQTTHSNDLVNLIFWKLLRISCPGNMETFPSPSAPLPPTLARLRAITVVLF